MNFKMVLLSCFKYIPKYEITSSSSSSKQGSEFSSVEIYKWSSCCRSQCGGSGSDWQEGKDTEHKLHQNGYLSLIKPKLVVPQSVQGSPSFRDSPGMAKDCA